MRNGTLTTYAEELHLVAFIATFYDWKIRAFLKKSAGNKYIFVSVET